MQHIAAVQSSTFSSFQTKSSVHPGYGFVHYETEEAAKQVPCLVTSKGGPGWTPWQGPCKGQLQWHSIYSMLCWQGQSFQRGSQSEVSHFEVAFDVTTWWEKKILGVYMCEGCPLRAVKAQFGPML